MSIRVQEQAISNKLIYGLILTLLVLLIIIFLKLAYFQTEAGYTYHRGFTLECLFFRWLRLINK